MKKSNITEEELEVGESTGDTTIYPRCSKCAKAITSPSNFVRMGTRDYCTACKPEFNKEETKTMKTEKKEKKDDAKKDAVKKAGKQAKTGTKKAKKTEHTPRPQSKSGKYQSIRHLAEVMFAKNKDISREEFVKNLVEEYPISTAAESEQRGREHYAKYKNMIVSHNIWLVIEEPKWAKKPGKKSKKEKE